MNGPIRYCPRTLYEEVLALGWELFCDFKNTHHEAYSAGFVIWPNDGPAPWPERVRAPLIPDDARETPN